MVTSHRFGGDWTETKLEVLGKYLHAYTTALSKQDWCHKIYVDAFAGTGYREDKRAIDGNTSEFVDVDARDFLKGSATIALETDPSFDGYLFIERKAKHALELEKLRIDYFEKKDSITIVNADANSHLRRWCPDVNWQQTRAVVFLDPYGMQVEWATLDILSQTKAIDLCDVAPQKYSKMSENFY